MAFDLMGKALSAQLTQQDDENIAAPPTLLAAEHPIYMLTGT
jgi:hypothetical protein